MDDCSIGFDTQDREVATLNLSNGTSQMILPLALENLTDQNISIELAPKKPNAIELNVTIRFSQKHERR